jgi:hypothetical protein
MNDQAPIPDIEDAALPVYAPPCIRLLDNARGDGLPQLFAALATARGQFSEIVRSKTVTVRPREKAPYTFSYAPLEEVLAATVPALAANGLALIQPIGRLQGKAWQLLTLLVHSSGARIEAEVTIPADPSIAPQALGSLLTYLRRYSLQGLLGVNAEDDDDGNAAEGNEVTSMQDRRKPPQVPQQKPQPRQEPARQAPAQKPQEAPAKAAQQPSPKPAPVQAQLPKSEPPPPKPATVAPATETSEDLDESETPEFEALTGEIQGMFRELRFNRAMAAQFVKTKLGIDLDDLVSISQATRLRDELTAMVEAR